MRVLVRLKPTSITIAASRKMPTSQPSTTALHASPSHCQYGTEAYAATMRDAFMKWL